jgi:hypothetical protein
MPKRNQKPIKIPKKRGGADKQTLYKPEYDTIVSNLVRLTGATITEIAEILGVVVATVYNWQARHESFRNALQMPLTIANHRVELSLYNESVGYFIEEEEIKVIEAKIVRVKKKVWMRPNATCLVWWTKCKAGYRDDAEPAKPEDGQIIEGIGIKAETERQTARRLAFVLHRGGKKEETAA